MSIVDLVNEWLAKARELREGSAGLEAAAAARAHGRAAVYEQCAKDLSLPRVSSDLVAPLAALVSDEAMRELHEFRTRIVEGVAAGVSTSSFYRSLADAVADAFTLRCLIQRERERRESPPMVRRVEIGYVKEATWSREVQDEIERTRYDDTADVRDWIELIVEQLNRLARSERLFMPANESAGFPCSTVARADARRAFVAVAAAAVRAVQDIDSEADTIDAIPFREVHALKTWPPFFDLALRGEKPFEFRINDRDFRNGDLLRLDEYVPDRGEALPKVGYTGRSILATVTKVISLDPLFPGMVALSLKIEEPAPIHGLAQSEVRK